MHLENECFQANYNLTYIAIIFNVQFYFLHLTQFLQTGTSLDPVVLYCSPGYLSTA